jgi:hypothetical protein
MNASFKDIGVHPAFLQAHILPEMNNVRKYPLFCRNEKGGN